MKYILYIVISLIVLVLIGFGISKIPVKPGISTDFATCIKDSGAKFYGAFWCSHCQEQKAMFGKSSKLLPYVECSTPMRQKYSHIQLGIFQGKKECSEHNLLKNLQN